MASGYSSEVWQYSCTSCTFCACSFCPMSPASKYCSLECKVVSGVHIRAFDECWLWTRSVSPGAPGHGGGYANVKFQHGHYKPHRVMWEIMNGPIPDGLCVLHRCDRPSCCNPNHLWLGTVQDNNRDCETKKRRTRARGERNGFSKLTQEDILAIRSSTLPVGTLAFRYNVHFATIYRIRNRESWRHL